MRIRTVSITLAMTPHGTLFYSTLVILNANALLTTGLNLEYLDPIKLQTKATAKQQQTTASGIIGKYLKNVSVEIDYQWFEDNKDAFRLQTKDGRLYIQASTGVAAVWGFNYYLKKYCKSQIDWLVKRVVIPSPLPEVNEKVVANDRFRYYQNVCTFSYSYIWWDETKWGEHVEWMALNGINLALAPASEEAAWSRVYKKIGMTEDEIEAHFTGPAFLSWLRMGNVHGWGGPLPKSWHLRQKSIRGVVVYYMLQLGMVPVLPAFNGHVPKAMARIYPNATFHSVKKWNKFNSDYCCGLYINPTDPLFHTIGTMFLSEVSSDVTTGNIYTSDPFNEVYVEPALNAEDAAKAIFAAMEEVDEKAVWLLQNWMFVHDPVLWPLKTVKKFITSVPNGRMLILDLQSEQWPQYDLYEMYYGQPFIWCMLHNFGGTLGMFGNMQTINTVVYEVRNRTNSTMIGTGLTPEGIHQNYVVYDLMLESAWRKKPVEDLDTWVEEYAERRYGCTLAGKAWRHLLRSVYSFNGLNRIRGKYVITRRPSFKYLPWAWYKSHDLFEAFKEFVFIDRQCTSPGFNYDLVDVTRQALQYRAEQIYYNFFKDRFSNTFTFNASVTKFMDAMEDLRRITNCDMAFTGRDWFSRAMLFTKNPEEKYIYELNARYQVTLWGPNGEISDYACKQWTELFHYYYIPRWRMFLSAALKAKERNEIFDEKATQKLIKATVETEILHVYIMPTVFEDPVPAARYMFEKWIDMPGLDDLPLNIKAC
ncbi:hypothetical protein O0L34_g10400 [Tuta absoluta]|nr:hypothetical protein O0L34_g10400 [Tuta absoluta]